MKQPIKRIDHLSEAVDIGDGKVSVQLTDKESFEMSIESWVQVKEGKIRLIEVKVER